MLYGEIKDIGSFFSFQYQVISLTSEAFNFSVQRPRRGSLCYSLFQYKQEEHGMSVINSQHLFLL